MTALPPLREVVRRFELRARKSLGQNFILDLNLTSRIARAAGPLEQTGPERYFPPRERPAQGRLAHSGGLGGTGDVGVSSECREGNQRRR